MNAHDKIPGIVPERLNLTSTFKFQCHSKIKCFTKCCRGISITLTPYDIIRLKNSLQLTSHEFLALYTTPQILEKTDLPIVTLRAGDDEQKSCPFVTDNGCIVYEDRPTTCRYYPLGVASLMYKEGAAEEGFYFFVNEPHCLGFEEAREWTVESWRKDQGVDIHDLLNAAWTDMIVYKRSFPPNIKFTDKTKQLFFMACYDIDKFREFVFESTFLDRYVIDSEIVDKIKNDEIALSEFGIKWLKSILYKSKDAGPFQLNEDAANSENAVLKNDS